MPDPVLLNLPPGLDTPRLCLRPPQTGDGPVLYEAVSESLTELRQFLASLPWVAGEQSADVSEIFCRTAQANFLARKDFPFLMFEKSTGQLIGACGLHRMVWDTPKVEIGYWCRSHQTGRGFVTEAVHAVMQYAIVHLGVARIEIVTDEENQPSRRVAERCGFVLEGILRHERRAPGGALRNTCIYAHLPVASGAATDR